MAAPPPRWPALPRGPARGRRCPTPAGPARGTTWARSGPSRAPVHGQHVLGPFARQVVAPVEEAPGLLDRAGVPVGGGHRSSGVLDGEGVHDAAAPAPLCG